MQRDDLYFPSWAYALPTTLLRLPYSITEAFVCTGIVYYVVGFASNPGR